MQDNLNKFDHIENQNVDHATCSEVNEDEIEDVFRQSLPPSASLMHQQSQTEETALNSQVDNTIVHLGRARKFNL